MREEFIAACPFPFLVGQAELEEPYQPGRTLQFFDDGATLATRRAGLARGDDGQGGDEGPLVLAVRKVHDTFPDMITVGRTRNNDVVLHDVQVSKFHAYFRLLGGGRVELLDAGSANGTRVGYAVLKTKGAAHPVRVGDRIG